MSSTTEDGLDTLVTRYEQEHGFELPNARILAQVQQSLYRTSPEGSAQTWSSGMRDFARWLRNNRDKGVTEASRADIDTYFERIGDLYESTTAGGKFHAVKHLYETIVRKEIIEENPAEGLEREAYALETTRTRQAAVLRQEQDYVAIPRQEVKQMWQPDHVPSPKLRNELLIKILWFTGMRSSEIVRIRLEDVDQDDRRIRIYSPKTDDYRDVWYPSRLDLPLKQWIDRGRDSLSPYADESDHLFLTHQSQMMRSSHVSRIVKQAARNAGLNEVLYTDEAGRKRWKITGHTLRHSFATYHANKNPEMKIHHLQELMGHDKLETTLKYVSDDPLERKRAVQAPW